MIILHNFNFSLLKTNLKFHTTNKVKKCLHALSIKKEKAPLWEHQWFCKRLTYFSEVIHIVLYDAMKVNIST